MDAGDIGGDNGILRGCGLHMGAKSVTIDLTEGFLRKLLQVSLCEVSRNGWKKRRERGSNRKSRGWYWCWCSCDYSPCDSLVATAFPRVGHDPPARDGDNVTGTDVFVKVQGRVDWAIMDNEVVPRL